jgi:hypothetical protein
MAGFDNDVVYGTNVDFTGGSPVTGQVTANGQLLIGSAVAPFLRANTLIAGTGISITNGAGTITITNTGGGSGGTGTNSLAGNTGSATQVGGVINAVGSGGLTTTGSGQTLTISSTGSLAALNALAGTGYLVQTAANTFTNRTFLAGTGISLTNADGVAGATTITASAAVPTTFTEDGASVATPSSNNLNILGTSAQGISTSGSGATVTITASNATATQKGVSSFNSTNFTVTSGAVASNALTVTAGTGLSTGGSVNLGGSVTLNLTVPVTVSNGGTGATSLTSNGVIYGSGTAAVGVTSGGTNGQVLVAATGLPPAWATVGGTQGVTLTGGANSLSIGLANVPNSALANSSITVSAGSGISVSGSPVSLGGTVIISATGAIPTQFTSDSGTAVPSVNNINLVGTSAQGLTTSATGSTVTFTNADWTTAQKGVGTLATNAETIAGTVTNKAVTPDDLKAKLGTQTAHGVAIFEGTTSALVPVGPNASSGIPLISQGLSADPAFGTAAIAGGGTNATSFSVVNGIVSYDGTRLVTQTGPQISTGGVYTNSKQIAFIAKVSPGPVSDVTGDGTTYTFVFNTTQLNVGSGFDGTSTFTAPVAGVYLIGGNATLGGLTASHTFGQLIIVTTGQTYNSPQYSYGAARTSNNRVNVGQTSMFYMNAGETAIFQVQVSNGSLVVDVIGVNFFGYLLG